jgi:eukaryotic-like serine/threonine-protein kinase
MGRVWRAADEMLDRPVAVKEMRIDGLDAEDARTRRERTLREARATARIDHPNVVRVYDVVDEGERLWIVMELIGGRSLERIMVDDGPLDPRETSRIGLGLVTALRQVHERGVLHRDIKPGNVLVEGDGERIVLTDFGIAAIQDMKALTMVGMLVGSPDYMAPERISGRPQGAPSDIWSLGATLCAALAGHSPFSRDTTLATLHAVLYEEPELPPTAGPLRDLLATLLAKDPDSRPPLADVEESLRPVAFPALARPTAHLTPHLPRPEPEDTVNFSRPHPEAPAPADGAQPPQGPPAPDTPAFNASTEATHPEPLTPEQSTRPAPGPHPLRLSPSGEPAPAPPPPSPKATHRAALTATAGLATAAAVVTVILLTNHGSPDDSKADATHPSVPAGSQPPTVEGTSRPPSLPPGTHEEAGGYAWATPKGWQRNVKTGAEVHYTSPDTAQELVAKSSVARGDLLRTWQKSEQGARQGKDYQKIRFEQTTFRGNPAVVWEYTVTVNDVSWHARLLGFNQKGRSYQVNIWYHPDEETAAVKTYDKVKDSFTVR